VQFCIDTPSSSCYPASVKIAYKSFRFQPVALRLIADCDRIVGEYQAQGFQLTLRQIYYQFVSHDLFPDDRKWRWTGSKWVRDLNGTKNAEPNYKWLGGVVNDARLAGELDWEAIEDRTRNLEKLPAWEKPSDIVKTCAEQFHIDLWKDQAFRPEVWIEKDALVGVIEPSCRELDVPYFSCRGYTSQSEMWRAGQRLLGYIRDGQQPVIFHFGDHDPSGKDMSRDIEDRLEMFISGFELHRIALNMSQVRKYNPPPNPAKLTDSRCGKYIEEFGDESWELDALEPSVIAALVQENITSKMDVSDFRKRQRERDMGRKLLGKIGKKWDQVVASL
jgi:hypothetical protein